MYYNYLPLGKSLRFSGLILHSHSGFSRLGLRMGLLRHIRSMLRLYLPHSVDKTLVEVHYGKFRTYVHLNRKGYFNVRIPLYESDVLDTHDLRLSVLSQGETLPVYTPEGFSQKISIADYKFGVISDIDDTILKTAATRFIKRIKNILFTSAYKRKNIEYSPSAYRRLAFIGGKIFYVSNSEANLFPVISAFLKYREFPPGAVFLKKNKEFFSFRPKNKSPKVILKTSHKIKTISMLLNTQPGKRFILIGDNGQWDPVIYRRIIDKFPRRILYVFLRDIHKKIDLHIDDYNGVPVVYFNRITDLKHFMKLYIR